MNLKAEVSQRFHKERAHEIAAWLAEDPARFAELIELVLSDDIELSKYSSWLINHTMDIDRDIILPHLEVLIHNLAKPKLHDWTVRSTVKALAEADIPEALQGHALQYCFDYLLDPKTAVAIQVHAMQTIFNISKNEPDLLRELREVIAERMPHGTAGFKSRGGKLLREIGKILTQVPR